MALIQKDKVKNVGMVGNDKFVGRVGCRMYDKDGNVVFEDGNHNTIVLGIRKTLVKLLAGAAYTTVESFPVVKQISLGTGDTAATTADEALEAEIDGSKKTTNTATIASDGLSVTFAFLYEAVDENVDGKVVKEMGLWDRDGNMLARTTVGSWSKTKGLYFEVYWTIGYAQS